MTAGSAPQGSPPQAGPGGCQAGGEPGQRTDPGGKEKKGESCFRVVFFCLFLSFFSCPEPASKRENTRTFQKPSSKPAATRFGVSPAAKVNTSREEKEQR